MWRNWFVIKSQMVPSSVSQAAPSPDLLWSWLIWEVDLRSAPCYLVLHLGEKVGFSTFFERKRKSPFPEREVNV